MPAVYVLLTLQGVFAVQVNVKVTVVPAGTLAELADIFGVGTGVGTGVGGGVTGFGVTGFGVGFFVGFGVGFLVGAGVGAVVGVGAAVGDAVGDALWLGDTRRPAMKAGCPLPLEPALGGDEPTAVPNQTVAMIRARTV